jgi:integrase
MLRSNPLARDGLTVVDIAPLVIEAKERAALKVYGSKSRAHKRYATERGILQNWLRDAPFAMWPAHAVESIQVQQWVDWLLDEAEGASGEPLSPSFVRQTIGFLKTVFARALPNQPNVVDLVKLPSKQAPQNIPYLGIEAQRRFFRSPQVKLADRVMVGCGMGAGLRIGELLAIEIDDVHLDSEDPYLTVKYGGVGHVPTKGRRTGRVELFEPALGFWQIWIRQYYRGGTLVFAGPRGGYQKKWAEKFPVWAEIAGVERLSSHIMRHSFSAAVLSGTWGYEPKSFEFVGRQLGHADTQTTERYYGAFAPGVWLNEVRRMTGRGDCSPRRPVTARELLGLADDAGAGQFAAPTSPIPGGVLDLVESSVESALPLLAAKMPLLATIPSLTRARCRLPIRRSVGRPLFQVRHKNQ